MLMRCQSIRVIARFLFLGIMFRPHLGSMHMLNSHAHFGTDIHATLLKETHVNILQNCRKEIKTMGLRKINDGSTLIPPEEWHRRQMRRHEIRRILITILELLGIFLFGAFCMWFITWLEVI